MQSEAFSSIYGSDKNIVLSAPTGSGKTVCFDFAIARLMSTDVLEDSFKARPLCGVLMN
jgi:replicative superfamily II helicase